MTQQATCGIFRSFGRGLGRLASPQRAVDTLSMLDFVTQELVGSEEWRRVLEAYLNPQGKSKQGNSAEEHWLPRVARLDGIESAQLCRLHGTLIALGFLKFEISGKAGMQYQLTPAGRQSLAHGLSTNAELEETAESSPEAEPLTSQA